MGYLWRVSHVCDRWDSHYSRNGKHFIASRIYRSGFHEIYCNNQSPAHIFAGRFFIGLAVGMMSTAVPTYESEVIYAHSFDKST